MKLVFVHGSGDGKEVWQYQTAYFRDSEAVALPGHPHGQPCPSVEAYMEWVRGYLWGRALQEVILVGHSLGGAIAMLYGLKYPEELKAIVLIATGARLRCHPMYIEETEEAIEGRRDWAQASEPRFQFVDPIVRKGLIERRVEVGPRVYLNDILCCDKFDIMDQVRLIKLPTLVIGATEDVLTPEKYSRYLADKIEGARLLIAQGATHYVLLERPDEINKAIEDFVKGLAAK